jgi:hypothetical protein
MKFLHCIKMPMSEHLELWNRMLREKEKAVERGGVI